MPSNPTAPLVHLVLLLRPLTNACVHPSRYWSHCTVSSILSSPLSSLVHLWFISSHLWFILWRFAGSSSASCSSVARLWGNCSSAWRLGETSFRSSLLPVGRARRYFVSRPSWLLAFGQPPRRWALFCQCCARALLYCYYKPCFQ
jgi:hypothetical protein